MSGPRLSRRAVLVAAGLVTAGCHGGGSRPAPHRAQHPLDRALTNALTAERQAIATCAAALLHADTADQARLQVQQAAHSVHLAALNALVDPSPSPTPSATPSTTTSAAPGGTAKRALAARAVTALKHRLATTASTMRALAATEGSGDAAAVFAAIAASHAVLETQL